MRIEAAQLIEKMEIIDLGWICCSCASTRAGEHDYCEKCKDVDWAKPVNYKDSK